MKPIRDIRKEYSKFSLEIVSVGTDPILFFNRWFDEAVQAEVAEPNALTLSTVSADGRPAGRIVLLKGVAHGKFVFYTNYQSQKGRELESNPACALTFFWPELERQIRIEGVAARTDAGTAEQYFQSRPRQSQIGAWASPQSAIIGDRNILEERVSQMEAKFIGVEKLPKPQQWGGYEVDPLKIEFWQGRPSRLHDRIVFTLVDGQWKINRLAP